MKWIVGLFSLFCFSVQASKPISVHLHEIELSGVLPQPYETINLTIKLDEETDDVVVFELYRGMEKLELPERVFEQLKNVNLDTLSVSHEMHRDEKFPEQSRFGDKGDWLHIDMTIGDKYRAHRTKEKIEQFKWGYDRIRITITKDKNVTYHVFKLSEERYGWSNWKN